MGFEKADDQEAAGRLKGRRVLVVEDEYLLANDLERGFEKI